jgi:MFS transporter, SHS family, sialic acid transporter
MPKPTDNRTQWMVLLAAFLGWLFDGYEMGLFPVIARPALKDLLGAGAGDDAIGWWMGVATATFLLGAACGGAVFGWLGDRIGRVKSMALSILAYSLVNGLGWFATEPWHLAGVRFLSALGMGGQWSLAVALVMESWPERWRPMLAGAIGAAANVGFLLVGVTARVHHVTPESWRWMMLVAAAPAFLVVFVIFAVPESQRWRDAVAISGNVKPMREVFGPALRRNTLLAICFASIALIGTWGSVQWLPLWANQMVAATGAGAEAAGEATANVHMIQAFGAITGAFVAPLLGARLGRRASYFLICLSSVLICGITFRTCTDYSNGFLLLAFCTSVATASMYGWFPLYFPELFPTRVRATGQGVSYNSGRVFAAVGALTQGQLVASFGGSYAKAGAIVSSIYLLGMILIWFAPETKGKSLPH